MFYTLPEEQPSSGAFYLSISGKDKSFQSAVPSGLTVAQIVGMLFEYMVLVTLPSCGSM